MKTNQDSSVVRTRKERSVSQHGKWQPRNPSASKSIRHSSADKTGPARKIAKSKTRSSKGSASQQRVRHSSADRTCAAQRWSEGCALVGVCGAGDGPRDAAAGDARDLVAPRHQLVVTHTQRRLGGARLTKRDGTGSVEIGFAGSSVPRDLAGEGFVPGRRRRAGSRCRSSAAAFCETSILCKRSNRERVAVLDLFAGGGGAGGERGPEVVAVQSEVPRRVAARQPCRPSTRAFGFATSVVGTAVLGSQSSFRPRQQFGRRNSFGPDCCRAARRLGSPTMVGSQSVIW